METGIVLMELSRRATLTINVKNECELNGGLYKYSVYYESYMERGRL